MLETVNEIIDKYINRRGEFESIDPEREDVLNDHFRNKQHSDIADYLMSMGVSETGGITALSGFYYQFLVTIEYITEMLEDEWDFVIMEYHDDVVVGKDNKIRFIQVKSSQKVKLEASESPASGLYTRKKKEINGQKYKQPNSWVDKLLSNAAIALKSDGYITEFQLYSSYHFIRTQNYNFDHYTDNKMFNKEPLDSDHLLKTILDPVFNDEGKEYEYITEYGESEKDLLTRFFLHTGFSLQELNKFQDYLCMKLNRILFRDYGENITIKVSDLNLIIGYLFENCTDKTNLEKLVITKEKLQPILDEIINNSLANASVTVSQHDSIVLIDKVSEELIDLVQGYANSQVITAHIYKYRKYLREWVQNEKGDIKKIIERLFDGTNKTSLYSKLNSVKKERSLLELFTIILMLLVGTGEKLEFEKNESLVSKKGINPNSLYAFLRLEVAKKKPEAIEKLKTIIKNTSLKEQLFLLEKDSTVIIQNYNDRSFNKKELVEIEVKDTIKIEEIEKYRKLNEVPITIKIIPGQYLYEDFYTGLDEEDIENYLKEVLRSVLIE